MYLHLGGRFRVTIPRPSVSHERLRPLRVLLLVASVVLLGACDFITPAAPDYPAQNAAIIREVFGPLGQAEKAVRVASCESGLNHNALSPGGTYGGLFQLGKHIVAIWAYDSLGNRLNARANVLAARDLFVQRGNWSAWPVCGQR